MQQRQLYAVLTIFTSSRLQEVPDLAVVKINVQRLTNYLNIVSKLQKEMKDLYAIELRDSHLELYSLGEQPIGFIDPIVHQLPELGKKWEVDSVTMHVNDYEIFWSGIIEDTEIVFETSGINRSDLG